MEEARAPSSNEDAGPVTVFITRQPRRGMESQFEDWLRGVLDEASGFPGHEATSVLRPADPAHPEYVLIVRFRTYADLKRWYESDERARWIEKVEPISEKQPQFIEQTGLETWFTVPGRRNPLPPPRRKMAFVTLVAIYPLVLLSVYAVNPVLDWMPVPARVLVTSAVLVVLMTWVVMPWLTRRAYPWLYPETHAAE